MASPLILARSLRALVRRGQREEVHDILAAYHPLLQETFPLEGEIETLETYEGYLEDERLEWDILVLYSEAQRLVGGVQWQILRAVWAKSQADIAWVEHIWLVNDRSVRRFPEFRRLLTVLLEAMASSGVGIGFMEFNDPEKMSDEERTEDETGGISAQERVKLWGRFGIHELGYLQPDGWHKAPYAQPAMGDGPPVKFLSLGFFSLDDPLADTEVETEDYRRLLERAHQTIPGIDPKTDPTCVANAQAIRALPVSTLRFRRLAGSPQKT